LTLDAVEKRFIVDATKEKLENAEGFDKDHWPPMADHAWATRLHSYYNVTPYWDEKYAHGDLRRSADSSHATDRGTRPAGNSDMRT
jgi:hypothetical protein